MENRRSFIKKSGLFMAATSLPLTACSTETKEDNKMLGVSKNENVILIVDTVKLELDPGNVKDYCHFVGQPDTTPIEEYMIFLNLGDTVTWLGLSSSSSTDDVHIEKIIRQRGTDVFDKPVLPGTGSPKKVIGTVLHLTENATLDQETFKKNYKYKLQFTINGKEKVYPIDPKIQVN